jgi:epsilon-lactone hydrolase
VGAATRRPDAELLVKRRIFADMMAQMAIETGVTVNPVQLGGVRAFDLLPESAPAMLLLYFHGGGYRMGTAESFLGFCSHLAVQLSCRVLVVDYRLAPENPFPAAFDDALAAYSAVLATYQAPVMVGGDSAGGGLAAALLLESAQRGLPGPSAGILLCPWADMRVNAHSYVDCADSDLLWSATLARQAAEMYLAGKDPLDPSVSPVMGDWSGQPAILVQASAAEVLRDDARLLAAVASQAGVDVEHHEFDAVPHVWQYGYSTSRPARKAIAQIRRFVQRVSPDMTETGR